ncbi:MAG: phage portal protein [SAR324 cluster bacterium]|nr:phage portal protein [SAR324 cluster bacterium]
MKDKHNIALAISVDSSGEIKFRPENHDPYLNLISANEDNNASFEPAPIKLDFLTQLVRESTAHSSCLSMKHDITIAGYQESKQLSYQSFSSLLTEFYTLGNCFILKDGNQRLPARFHRYSNFKAGKLTHLLQIKDGSPTGKKYKLDEIIHIKRTCLESEIYGLPNYLASIPYIVLLKAATAYRNRFYSNGTHGRIVLTSLPNDTVTNEEGEQVDSAMIKQFREFLNGTKQAGSHSSIHINVNDTDIKAAENFINVVELGQKLTDDDFKITSERADSAIIVSHGIVPDLVGMVSTGKSSPNFERVMKVAKQTIAQPTRELFSSMLGIKLNFLADEEN